MKEAYRGRQFPIPYVTERTFPDPTANNAIRHAMRGDEEKEPDTNLPTDRQLLTRVQKELTSLRQRRDNGEITRGEFNLSRRPLRVVLKALRARENNPNVGKVIPLPK